MHQAESARDDLRAGVVLQNLGRLLDRKGNTLQAEKAYLRAIGVLNRSAESEDRFLVRAYAGLTAIYIQTGRPSKAESLIKRVLADHPAAAESDKASRMGNLGVILAHKQQFDEAERVFRATEELCTGSSSPELREVCAIATANAASLQFRAGRPADALASYRWALAVFEALPSPSPATLVLTLAEYAGVLRGFGDRDVAEGMYRKAIAAAEARLGSSHPALGALLQGYAQLLRDTGRKSEARRLAGMALRIRNESARDNLLGHTIEIGELRVRATGRTAP